MARGYPKGYFLTPEEIKDLREGFRQASEWMRAELRRRRLDSEQNTQRPPTTGEEQER